MKHSSVVPSIALVVCILTALTHITNAQNGWVSVTSGTTNTLHSVSFPDTNTAMAVGDAGTILRSIDGGATWSAQAAGTNVALRGVLFTDANTGTVVGDGGTILRTTNGGIVWTSQTSGTTSGLNAVSFINADIGTAVGNGGTIVHTTDGGTTWINQASGVPMSLTGVSLIDANTGIVVAAGSYTMASILKTTDGGATWNQIGYDLYGFTAVSFSDVNHGIAVGWGSRPYYGYKLAITNNGGSIWSWHQIGPSGGLTLYGVDANTSTMVGRYGLIFRGFGAQTSGTNINLLSVAFANSDKGIIVGSNGTILRTTNGGAAPPLVPALKSPASGANNVATSRIILEWNYPSGANQFRLQVAKDSSFSSPNFEKSISAFGVSSTIDGTSYSIDSLDYGTTYFWRINASNSYDTSDWSSVWSFTTEPPPPPPPAEGWVKVASGTETTLRGVSFGTAHTGAAVGDGGVILHTADGGVTWIAQSSGTTANLRSVSFVNAHTGNAVGDSGIILRTSDAGASWIRQASGTTNPLYGISLTDVNTGTAVGNSGIILRTTDGGVTWISQSSGTTFPFWGVCFTDFHNGTAVGPVGTIRRTTDGGATWNTQSSGQSAPLFGVSFINASVGVIVSLAGGQIGTTNGGAVWTRQSTQTNVDMYAVSQIDDSAGTTVGNAGYIQRTTDGGHTWLNQSSGTTVNLYGICFTDADNGIAVGAGGTILRTTNGGNLPSPEALVVYDDVLHSPWIDASWNAVISYNSTEQYNSGSNSIKVAQTAPWGALSLHYGEWGSAGIDLSAYGSLEFAAHGGTTGTILSVYFEDDSSNSGPAASSGNIPANQWKPVSIPLVQINPEHQQFHRLSIQDAGGSAGTFYLDDIKFTGSSEAPALMAKSGQAAKSAEERSVPQVFNLAQNYPNPFNPATMIGFTLQVSGFTTLKVYDVLGREVATLVNENLEAGVYHQKTFNASNLASGIYFARLESNGKQAIKKLMLMK